MRSPNSNGAPAPSSPSAPPPDLAAARRLGRADLPLETVALARALVGTLLLRRLDGELLGGRIVETEAYAPGDAASHAFRGPTKRNGAMFGRHLLAYVYLIYGTAFCLNVVSEDEGAGAAVLVRAIEPLIGLDAMRARRPRGIPDRDLARGPGRLCTALGIGPESDGVDLASDPALWLADDGTRPELGSSVRIGITRAAEVPHRFYARGSRWVSGPRALSP